MTIRFNREQRVKSEVEQLGRLVFPPFRSHLHKVTGQGARVAGEGLARDQLPKRILFIEDDRFIADMYRMGLEAGGWPVEIAYDGESGLNQALADPPALILLDDEARKLGIVDWMVKANTTPATLLSRVGKILAD